MFHFNLLLVACPILGTDVFYYKHIKTRRLACDLRLVRADKHSSIKHVNGQVLVNIKLIINALRFDCEGHGDSTQQLNLLIVFGSRCGLGKS